MTGTCSRAHSSAPCMRSLRPCTVHFSHGHCLCGSLHRPHTHTNKQTNKQTNKHTVVLEKCSRPVTCTVRAHEWLFACVCVCTLPPTADSQRTIASVVPLQQRSQRSMQSWAPCCSYHTTRCDA